MISKKFLANIGKAVVVTLAAAGAVWCVSFQFGHYAWSGEAAEQIPINADAIARVTILAEKLGDRASAEDAAAEERRRLCLARQLHSVSLCAEVGVEVTTPRAEGPP